MLDQKATAERSVRERYSQAAQAQATALCCPVEYDPQYLKVIPHAVIERDYGCGDPSKYLHAGETVLDLGSGSGKICFIAAQVVGESGRVIGIDMNDAMLALSRTASRDVADALGYSNVEFRKGRIQDLKLNRDRVDQYLKDHPIADESGLTAYEEFAGQLAASEPLVESGSIDAVVSNCVLNLVTNADKTALFQEIFRVLKRGGRAVISDIVADEPVPAQMQSDPELWSGCISGAFEEAAFLKAFTDAGFYGVAIAKRDTQPWRVVNGSEFRAVTVVAYRGKEGACWDHKEAVIYHGPFSAVTDDDGHTYPRGARVAVCRKTFEILTRAPYAANFSAVTPLVTVAPEAAPPFPCTGGVLKRHPRETKGEDYGLTTTATDAAACGPAGCC